MTDTIGSGHVRWGLWATVLWGVVIGLCIFIVQTLTLSVYIGIKFGPESGLSEGEIIQALPQDGLATSIATVATFIVCTSVLMIIVKLKSKAIIKDYLALKAPGLTISIIWFCLFLAIMYVLHVITSYFGVKPEMEYVKNIYSSAQYFWLLAIAIVIAAPVFEELFFRGFLVGGWKDTEMGPTGAVVVSALLWSVIHTQYNILVMVQIFVLGLILGFARIYSRSTLLPIGLHAFNNLASLLYMIALSSNTTG